MGDNMSKEFRSRIVLEKNEYLHINISQGSERKIEMAKEKVPTFTYRHLQGIPNNTGLQFEVAY